MKVDVRLFAGLRERHGTAGAGLELPEGACVADAWAALLPGEPLSDNVLAARNMEYTRFDTRLAEGDEVAFFPPVTGGGGR